ncbi:MAG: phytanoyl-CoA dioxygenase family protein [Pseudomonadales bacterium]|jgi:ectoine hydroxylase-related dioxygenase (phytanoyl-CoA dioxygenase family)
MGCDYVEHFHENGYAVVRGVFHPGEIAELGEAFDRIYAEGMARGFSYRHQNVFFRVTPDPALGRIVRMVQWPAYFDEVLARYRVDPRMGRLLAPFLGADVKQIINQLHWKPPGAVNVDFAFHQDIRSRRPRTAYLDPARSYVQTGIAVDAHAPENGCMTVLPGSHKLGELGFDDRPVLDRPLTDEDLRAVGLNPADKVDLVLEPGDVAMWHLYLVHGSGPNTSACDRRFHINGYVRGDRCSRGEWAFRGGMPCVLGKPVLVHYEELYTRPGPFYVD